MKNGRPWPPYLTAKQAGEYAGVSAWTIRRNVKPFGRRGRSWTYATADVERWMAGAPVADEPTESSQRPREAPSPVAESLERIRRIGKGGVA